MVNKSQFSDNALVVLKKRFLKTDREGNPVETPNEMFWRVANNIASADTHYAASPDEVARSAQEFYEVMASQKFLPATTCLRNSGRRMQQLFPCFVLPLEDSLESIYETLKNSALIFRTGGAVGISFSNLRPRGDFLDSTGGTSSGPVSFMKLFDVSTDVINEGCMRYGGVMGILRVDHPDILEFIEVKEDDGVLNNFNLSVAVTDKFMEALAKGDDYELFNPKTAQAEGKISAATVFDKIASSAWSSGEPGLLFIDEINRHNPTPHLGPIEAVNLCGVQPLLPYEGCNLGAITVSKFVGVKGKIKYTELGDVVSTAVHFLDNSIDVNHYVLSQTKDMAKGNRKIGLGIRGFAELLMKMWVPYHSDEARSIAVELMRFISEKACEVSAKIARKRGNFPKFLGSVWDKKGVKNMRNAALTTLAPTGTTSLIADCTGGIEPVYALVYKRKHMKTLKGQDLFYVHPEFERVAKTRGFYSPELLEKIAKTGSCRGVQEVPEDVQEIFATAYDITPDDHVKMQAAFQKYTDNAVSKTVNMPYDSTVEDTKRVFELAYQLKCKGITVYRDKSRRNQVLNVGR